MPLFDFKCKVCGSTEEFLVRNDSEMPQVCNACGCIDSLNKQIGHSHFALKGGGWAKDLYASVPEKEEIRSNK